MADLRTNVRDATTGGVMIGVVGFVNRFIVNGVPYIHDVVVGTLGRWGEPVFAVAMGFVLDLLDTRVNVLERLRIPSRWFAYGVYRAVSEALDAVSGRGYAYITANGEVKTDTGERVAKIYMQKGDSVVEVQPGSATAGFGIKRYVAVDTKRVYYIESPYELPAAGGGGSA